MKKIYIIFLMILLTLVLSGCFNTLNKEASSILNVSNRDAGIMGLSSLYSIFLFSSVVTLILLKAHNIPKRFKNIKFWGCIILGLFIVCFLFFIRILAQINNEPDVLLLVGFWLPFLVETMVVPAVLVSIPLFVYSYILTRLLLFTRIKKSIILIIVPSIITFLFFVSVRLLFFNSNSLLVFWLWHTLGYDKGFLPLKIALSFFIVIIFFEISYVRRWSKKKKSKGRVLSTKQN